MRAAESAVAAKAADPAKASKPAQSTPKRTSTPSNSTNTSDVARPNSAAVARAEQLRAARIRQDRLSSGGTNSVDDAARGHAQNDASAKGKGPRSQKSNDSKRDAAAAGRANAFEGKSTARLDRIHAKIERLSQHRETLASERQEATQAYSAAQREISAATKVSNPVAKALNPIVGMFGIKLGASNDAAGEARNKADEAKHEAMQAAYAESQVVRKRVKTNKNLNEAQQINAVVQTAHVAGIGAKEVEKLDNAATLAKFDVANTDLGSDGEYDAAAGKVTISGDSAKVLNTYLKSDRGYLDRDGFVKSTADTGSDRWRRRIGTTTMVMHEFQHMRQDARGEVTAASKEARSQMALDARDIRKQRKSGTISAGQARELRQRSTIRAAKHIISRNELAPNVRQEQNERAAGKSTRFSATLDANGAQLPRTQQLANLWNMYTNKPLPYGPSAGKVLDASSGPTDDYDFALMLAGSFTDKNRPADERDGRNRPGRNRPADERAADERDGRNRPGRNRPAEVRDGRNRPGMSRDL